MTIKNTFASFEAKYIPEPNSGCWLWLGKIHTKRHLYGVFNWQGQKVLAHRFAYQQLVGRLPRDQELDHLCQNTLCVNPQHLEAVTHIENMRRGREATKLRCVHDHAYVDGFEYYYRSDGEGVRYRRCLTCYKLKYPASKKISEGRQA